MSRYVINMEMRYFMTYDNSNVFCKTFPVGEYYTKSLVSAYIQHTGITLGFWSGGPWAHLTKILWAQGPEDQIAYYIGCVNNMNS